MAVIFLIYILLFFTFAIKFSIPKSLSPYIVLYQGGVKILVTGPWHSTQDVYSCIFDQTNVPAALVQTGVLRCYSPGNNTHCRH